MFKPNIGFLLCLILRLGNSDNCIAQYKHIDIFSNDSSFVLINKLVQDFRPATVLDYSNARLKMYQEIYNFSDSVSCVYTDHTLYLSPATSDPIGYLSKNGNANGINCEHTFPQSKGADSGNARSDMHHLFPSRAAVNEARSNYPFGEIIDSKTNDWYFRSFSQTTIPTQQIEVYSESINGLFEPREDHKGNVARAVFYFFTMYELQADRSFFESMRTTLCDWHLKDPTDSLEWTRTYQIANFQDNKPNPFILDCSLAKRSYCNQSALCKKLSGTVELDGIQLKAFPNPFTNFIEIFSDHTVELNVEVFNGIGIKLFQNKMTLHSSINRINLELLEDGLYILILSNPQKQFLKRISLLKAASK